MYFMARERVYLVFLEEEMERLAGKRGRRRGECGGS